MYLDFYKLKVKPFDITTNPKFLWLGEKHREALATLRYGIQGNMGFLLLTGDVGTGKTTLIYELLNELGSEVAVANVPDPGLPPLDFYNYIAAAFGIEREFATKGAFLAAFSRFLHEAHQKGRKILLIIDESQRLSDKLLEEIRLLSNIERQETKLINIFFVGQIEFNTVLAKHQNRALRQRITVNYHINPFSEKETREYIAHRLKVAGGAEGLFSAEAAHEVFTFSKGYPRLINVICDRALLTGFVEETRSIGPKIVRECAAELTIPAPAARPARERMETTPPADGETSLPRSAPPAAQPMRIKPVPLQPPGEAAPLPDPDHLVLPRPTPKPVPSQAGHGTHWHAITLATILIILGILAGVAYILYPEELEKAVTTFTTGVRSMMDQWSEREPASSGVGVPAPPATPARRPAPEEPKADRPPTPPVEAAPPPAPPPPPPPQPAAEAPAEPAAPPASAPPAQTAPPQETAVPAPQPEAPRPTASALLSKPLFDPLPLDAPLIISFDYDSNDLPAEVFNILERFADTVNHDPAVTEIVLRGYSDNVGSEHYNQRLSNFRAQLIRSYLMGKGLTRIPFTIQAMGSKDPIAGNDTAEGRKKNRRVELRAVKQ